MKRAAALVLALVCCVFVVQCGRLGPPRRTRPANEAPRTVDPTDPNDPALRTPAP
jgi:hypothetical protein